MLKWEFITDNYEYTFIDSTGYYHGLLVLGDGGRVVIFWILPVRTALRIALLFRMFGSSLQIYTWRWILRRHKKRPQENGLYPVNVGPNRRAW